MILFNFNFQVGNHHSKVLILNMINQFICSYALLTIMLTETKLNLVRNINYFKVHLVISFLNRIEEDPRRFFLFFFKFNINFYYATILFYFISSQNFNFIILISNGCTRVKIFLFQI